MPLSPPNLTSESQAKIDLMRLRGAEVVLDYYEGSGWSAFIKTDAWCYFDAPDANDCVNDAFDYFLGVFGDKS